MEHPDSIPPSLETDVMRHEMIDGDIYVNLDDLLKIIRILDNDYVRSASAMISKYGLSGLNIANTYGILAAGTNGLISALTKYADQAKFEKVIGENDEQ